MASDLRAKLNAYLLEHTHFAADAPIALACARLALEAVAARARWDDNGAFIKPSDVDDLLASLASEGKGG